MHRALVEPRFLRFALVGFFATFTHVTALAVQVELLGVPAVAASVPAFLLAMGSSYIANRRWTFQARGAHRVQLPKFVLVSVAGLGINVLIMYVMVDMLHHWYGVALILVIVIVPTVTYILNRDWTFG